MNCLCHKILLAQYLLKDQIWLKILGDVLYVRGMNTINSGILCYPLSLSKYCWIVFHPSNNLFNLTTLDIVIKLYQNVWRFHVWKSINIKFRFFEMLILWIIYGINELLANSCYHSYLLYCRSFQISKKVSANFLWKKRMNLNKFGCIVMFTFEIINDTDELMTNFCYLSNF